MPHTQWVPAAYCPMGCGASVHRDPGNGNLICLADNCPRPHGVMDILSEREQEHLVTFAEDPHFYNLRHPLRERLDNQLLECEAARGLMALLETGCVPEQNRIYRLSRVTGSEETLGEYRLEAR